jgi:hypothetical protein
MSALEKLWSRPVNVETVMEGARKVYTVKGGEFSERAIDKEL